MLKVAWTPNTVDWAGADTILIWSRIIGSLSSRAFPRVVNIIKSLPAVQPEIYQHEHMHLCGYQCMRTYFCQNPAFHRVFPISTKKPHCLSPNEDRPIRIMSTQQVNNESLQAERILANCKKIWGADKEFDIDIDCDKGPWGDCQAYVREDRGLSFGPMLTMTNVCEGSKRAWNELDRMLRLWARQVESGKPMSREEMLDIFSRPSGENRAALGQFMDAVARGGANGVANPSLA